MKKRSMQLLLPMLVIFLVGPAQAQGPASRSGVNLNHLTVDELGVEFYEKNGFDGTIIGHSFQLSICQVMIAAFVRDVPAPWAGQVARGDLITLASPDTFKDPQSFGCSEQVDVALKRGLIDGIPTANLLVVPAATLARIGAYVKENGHPKPGTKFPRYFSGLLQDRKEITVPLR